MEKMVFMLILTIFFVGCQEELDETDSLANHLAIQIFGSVSPIDASCSTKTSISGSTASFTSKDSIGVTETLTKRSNTLFTYNGISWSTTTPMYWYNQSSTHTFYAYYPYSVKSQDSLTAIPILANQKISATPDVTCDMLIAKPKTQKCSDGTNVALTFTHAFSLLQFNIKSGILSLSTLNSIILKGGNSSGSSGYGIVNTTNSISNISYSLATQKVRYTVNNASTLANSFEAKSPVGITLGSVTVTVYVLILPGTYTTPSTGLTVQFKGTLLGLVTTTSEASLATTLFEPNKKYIYEVKKGILAADNEVKLIHRKTLPLETEKRIFREQVTK